MSDMCVYLYTYIYIYTFICFSYIYIYICIGMREPCAACGHTVTRANTNRRNKNGQCLLWAMARGATSAIVRNMRADENYWRRRARGSQVFQAYLKDSVAMQRSSAKQAVFAREFMPFLPVGGGMGVGGDVVSIVLSLATHLEARASISCQRVPSIFFSRRTERASLVSGRLCAGLRLNARKSRRSC